MDKYELWQAYDDKNSPSVEWARQYPTMSTHKAFDAGYEARDEEVARLRELLRKALPYVSSYLEEGCAEVSEAIEAELAKE